MSLVGIKMDEFDLEHNEEQLPTSDSATTVTVSLYRAARALIFVTMKQNIRTRESFEQDREFDDDDDYYYDPNLEEDVARIGASYYGGLLDSLLTLAQRTTLLIPRCDAPCQIRMTQKCLPAHYVPGH